MKTNEIPAELSEVLSSKREAMIARLQGLSEEQQALLFDGDWMTKDEVKKRYRSMKWRDRRLVLESLGAIGLLLFLTAGVFVLFIETIGVK